MTRSAARAAVRIAGALACVALTAGCSLLDGDGGDPSPSDSPGQGAEDERGTVTGAGRPLDQDELDAALPSPAEIGDGWGEDSQETVSELTDAQISPERCQPLVLKGPGWDEIQKSQRARAQDNYVDGDSVVGDGEFMVVWTYSLDEPLPNQLFDDAGALISDCGSMEVSLPDTGTVVTYKTTPLAFPNLGDRTLAMRIDAQQPRVSTTMDFVVVKVGHNTVTVASTSYGGEPDTRATEKAARTALDKLAEGS